MKLQFLITMLVLGFSLRANPAETAEPVSVDAICGKLVSIEEVPEKGTTNALRQQIKPVSRARVRLFSPTISADCCEMMTPMAEVTTGRDGSFRFKKPGPGDYWLVATLGGADHKLLIRYEPGKKPGTECSEFLYALEKGKFQLRRSLTGAADQK